MNINIYYGGRGVIEDPTLFVLKKIENVFDELRVKYTRYNLFDMKNSITTLPQTMKEADGIILADCVEWLGLSGYMHQLLDATWLYGDKDKISNIYMAPVVISTTTGEKEACLTLNKAWELLGGRTTQGICCYVEDNIEFETNTQYVEQIEKAAENLYRTISHKLKSLPSSCNAIRQTMIKTSLELSPQESEQLSKYVADDTYVKQQKEDIEELSSMFKLMLSAQGNEFENEHIKSFLNRFIPQKDFAATYQFIIDDNKSYIYLKIDNSNIICKYEQQTGTDIVAKLSSETLSNIMHGRITFQRAFMTGEMTAKGNFKTLRMLDSIFNFQ